jgi:site-specific recombinase XerD
VRAESCEQFAGRTWTVARWLRYWLSTRRSIRPTTLRSYTQHVETFLIPLLGDLRLAEVTSRHLTAMFAEVAAGATRSGQPRSAGTLQRVRATLRAAFNAAVREGLIGDNPARRVEMPPTRRAPTRLSGPSRGSSGGGRTALGRRWRSGPRRSSWTSLPTIRCSLCGG